MNGFPGVGVERVQMIARSPSAGRLLTVITVTKAGMVYEVNRWTGQRYRRHPARPRVRNHVRVLTSPH
jgi:hypothetical protein